MYANVCALSLFLTCGPYARLPAWAGENSPECLILLNKRHEEACQVLHGPCQSLPASLFFVSCSAPSSALIRRRKWNVAAAASCCGSILLFFGGFFSLLFSRLFWLPAVTDDTAPSAQTEGRSVTQHEPNAPRPPPPSRHSRTHTENTHWQTGHNLKFCSYSSSVLVFRKPEFHVSFAGESQSENSL